MSPPSPGPVGGEGGVRPDGLAEGIARLRRALRRGARVADPGNTLAVAQLELLAALAEHPGSRPGQLARLLNMRPNTVTTIVNALTGRAMVRRVAAEDDRRAVELTVTEDGREAVLAWQATNAAVLHLALSTLPAHQRRALAAAVPALDALARAVDRLADTPDTQLRAGSLCPRARKRLKNARLPLTRRTICENPVIPNEHWRPQEGNMARGIQVSDKAPDFTLPSQSGEPVRLHDRIGQRVVVLYFYPKDNTSGCTAQACAFRDSYEVFTDAGADVIGVSSDSVDKHAGFAGKFSLPFTLLSDAGGKVRKLYGVPAALGFIPGRVTYVIDLDGTVRHVFNSMTNINGHVSQALEAVKQLQAPG